MIFLREALRLLLLLSAVLVEAQGKDIEVPMFYPNDESN